MEEFNMIYLFNFEENTEHAENENFKNILNCDWKNCLKNEVIENNKLKDNLDKKELLLTGISSLLLFIQNNFTGPTFDLNEINLKFDLNVANELKVDSEELNCNVVNPELLYLSKLIFEHLKQEQKDDFIVNIWYIRFLIIYQKVLEDLTESIYEKFHVITESMVKELDAVDKMDIKILVILEILQGYIYFKRITKSGYWMNKLKENSGVEIDSEGILGVRTKFQRKALPQLALKVSGADSLELKSSELTHGSTTLPTLLKLDDDVRLEKITFNSEEDNMVKQQSSLIQNMIWTKLMLLIVSQPKDTLADEEIQPYITNLLYQNHGAWTTRLMTLFSNIKLESNHKRTVDRSLKQCEGLVSSINSTEIPVNQRLSLIFSSGILPRWELEAKLGDLMISLGMIKAALDLYLKLHMWEDVIVCYTVLELRHKAAEIIRQQLEVKPTVKLYCLLGDATDDEKCYEKAWEFSKETSARAQRHWGNFYFAKKEYANCLPHLKKSIEINSLQEVTLLRLGYAALELEMWEDAAKAYRHYTNLESQGFESWNNLAKAYIKLGDKKRAHKVLQEALKCNFGNWKVWENFMIVSVDTGYFEDALNAYEQLLDIKEKFYDKQIIEIVVDAIANDLPDANGNSTKRLAKKAQKILGHASSKQPNNGFLYELSSRLSGQDYLNRAQKLQNAYRGYTQSNSNWSKKPDSCLQIIILCIDLCENSLKASENIQENTKASVKSQISSARLTGQGVVKAASNENWEECQTEVLKLKEIIEKLTEILKSLM